MLEGRAVPREAVLREVFAQKPTRVCRLERYWLSGSANLEATHDVHADLRPLSPSSVTLSGDHTSPVEGLERRREEACATPCHNSNAFGTSS